MFSRKEHIFCYTQTYGQFVTFITSIINEFECQLIRVVNYSWIIQPRNINGNQTVCVLVSYHIKILFYVVIAVTTVYHVILFSVCLKTKKIHPPFFSYLVCGLWLYYSESMLNFVAAVGKRLCTCLDLNHFHTETHEKNTSFLEFYFVKWIKAKAFNNIVFLFKILVVVNLKNKRFIHEIKMWQSVTQILLLRNDFRPFKPCLTMK